MPIAGNRLSHVQTNFFKKNRYDRIDASKICQRLWRANARRHGAALLTYQNLQSRSCTGDRSIQLQSLLLLLPVACHRLLLPAACLLLLHPCRPRCSLTERSRQKSSANRRQSNYKTPQMGSDFLRGILVRSHSIHHGPADTSSWPSPPGKSMARQRPANQALQPLIHRTSSLSSQRNTKMVSTAVRYMRL